jgi:pantoate--beta-alanine ligase
MHKLLNIVQPNDLFMGQKDYQQCMVVKKLIETENIDTNFHIVSTQREKNGLAMSSRNLRLSADALERAGAIYQALHLIKANIPVTPIDELKAEAGNLICDAGFEKIDYITICDGDNLVPVEHYDPEIKSVALAAAFIEGVRLIDNLRLN